MKLTNLTSQIGNFIDDRPKLKKYLPQGLTLFFIIFIFSYFTFNAQTNMGNRGIVFGFGFLQQEASFDIQFSLIDYDGSYSYARAYLVGLLNTLLVSVIGIFFATILGVVIGISRLSPNYLNLNYLAGGTYKIPPLVQSWFGPLSGKIPVSAMFLL